ncbi:hypothetical protein [Fodinibius sp.]|uniref:hypothetical protein n=1 Tax=Fodinibius sp. TaxID=1872440 RepID=UPI00356AC2DC
MTTFDPETAEIKFSIADAATDLYVEGNGHFLIKDVAKIVGIDPADVFNYFPNKQAILQFYYTAIIYRYRLMIDEIDHFESYTLGEKLSNFAYASFDMLDEKKAFVKDTFPGLILHSRTRTDFEKETENLLRQLLEDDPQMPASSSALMNDYFYALLRNKYLRLIRFRLSDTSEDHELTMELTDKLATFLQELLYSSVLDQGFELGKFLYANRKHFLYEIPVVKQIFSKIEIR